jgi:hypothetical protein
LRLRRTGDTLEGYKSTDGLTWTLGDTRTIGMASSIWMGLAVASGTLNTLNVSAFNAVSVVP